MKKLIKITSIVFVLLMVFATVATAATPYTTYTYSVYGDTLESPDAYVPYKVIDSAAIGLETPFADMSDIEADTKGNLYIIDKSNNRVVVIDKYYRLKYIISTFVNEYGVDDSFSSPSSTFVFEDRELYVCDTFNKRLLVFNVEDGSYIKSIDEPESELLGADFKYSPISCVKDKYGRLYVVSQDTTSGIIVMTADGNFINYIGAPKVTLTALDALIQLISPGAAKLQTFVPTTYVSLDLDKTTNEFVYATIIYSESDHTNQLTQITSKKSDYSPVKLLNAKGADIMDRDGFFAPAGEVSATFSSITKSEVYTGPSVVSDVASGPNGIWSIVDSKRSKIYTYDRSGNLLYAFGDLGFQLGNIQYAAALTYQGNKIVVVDKKSNQFTIYRPTEYAQLLEKAIYYQNKSEFEKAVGYWEEVLTRNNNFDTAYVAIGKSYYRAGEYEKAIEYYKSAYDTENYATAFKEVRKQTMEKIFLWVILGIVVLLFLVVKLFKYAAKVNKNAQHKTGRKTFKEEFFYGFHLMFHPFDGFWDLKHEKRGSVRASLTFIVIAILAFYYQTVGAGYYVSPFGGMTHIYTQFFAVVIPLLLWVLSNWCFTTLFDGEGSFKDIFIATSYATYPIPALVVISTILTNVLVGSEVQITTMLVSIGYIWMGLLLVIGMQVTHDYSTGKNILTVIATLVGMVFIMFIAVLFTTLISKMVGFVSTIVNELSYR